MRKNKKSVSVIPAKKLDKTRGDLTEQDKTEEVLHEKIAHYTNLYYNGTDEEKETAMIKIHELQSELSEYRNNFAG